MFTGYPRSVVGHGDVPSVVKIGGIHNRTSSLHRDCLGWARYTISVQILRSPFLVSRLHEPQWVSTASSGRLAMFLCAVRSGKYSWQKIPLMAIFLLPVACMHSQSVYCKRVHFFITVQAWRALYRSFVTSIGAKKGYFTARPYSRTSLHIFVFLPYIFHLHISCTFRHISCTCSRSMFTNSKHTMVKLVSSSGQPLESLAANKSDFHCVLELWHPLFTYIHLYLKAPG